MLDSWICEEDTVGKVADVWAQTAQVSVKAGIGLDRE